MNELIEIGQQAPAEDGELNEQRRARLESYLEHLYSDNTKKAYRSDWNHWDRWCRENERSPIPASSQDIVAYLLDFGSELKPSTLSRRLITIGKAHKHVGLPSPTDDEQVRQTFRGLTRAEGRRIKRASPLLASDIRALIDASEGADLLSVRNRAVLLIGWFGAFRQSELAALHVRDIQRQGARGVALLVRQSKTDQTGIGHLKWFNPQENPDYCPIQALERWLSASGLRRGPLFRSIGRWGHLGDEAIRPQTVTDILRRMAERADYDPTRFSGHSLRRGFCVQAAMNGASLDEIMAQTHHRDVKTVMRYIEEANTLGRNAINRISL